MEENDIGTKCKEKWVRLFKASEVKQFEFLTKSNTSRKLVNAFEQTFGCEILNFLLETSLWIHYKYCNKAGVDFGICSPKPVLG